jgi:UV DNA damage endonuclease
VVEALDGPADLMLEAKDKDLALFALRQEAAAEAPAATV